MAAESEMPRIASVEALLGSYLGQLAICGPAIGSGHYHGLSSDLSFRIKSGRTFYEVRPGIDHVTRHAQLERRGRDKWLTQDDRIHGSRTDYEIYGFIS